MHFLLRLPLFVGLGAALVLGLGYAVARCTGNAALNALVLTDLMKEMEASRAEECELNRQLSLSKTAIELKQRHAICNRRDATALGNK